MRDEDAVRLGTERMAMVFNDWGFPRMASRVLMTVMTADEDALTATQIGERLGVSPAAVSGAVRYLIHVGLLTKEPLVGSRSDVYRLPDNPWYEASALKSDLFAVLVALTDETANALGEGTPAARRVRTMNEYFRFVQENMPILLDLWRKYKVEHGLD
ncbi:GbsR/MarR family transcriptional regulator [Herbidospora mongoliensis]|uniref:GbsR/MarR family transcriptional regulator n=1 Tax=Herbidospora mongoliensis TaxID=688067 RepID=UPI00082A30B2|nr:helix-turn-helix domain-containing protein [Herbidospora mongoliensis]